jgi:hypothetical protein
MRDLKRPDHHKRANSMAHIDMHVTCAWSNGKILVRKQDEESDLTRRGQENPTKKQKLQPLASCQLVINPLASSSHLWNAHAFVLRCGVVEHL